MKNIFSVSIIYLPALFFLFFINGLHAQSTIGAEKLMEAIKAKDLENALVLVHNVDDLNYIDHEIHASLLMGATAFGYTELVNILLDKGANYDLQDPNGYTALMVASSTNHLDIARVLLEKGANPDLKSNSGQTAMMLASQYQNYNIVKLLMANGASTGSVSEKLMFALKAEDLENARILVQNVDDANFMDSDSTNSLIMMASWFGYNDVLQILLEKGANPDLQSSFGITALMQASYAGKADITKLLLEKGANPNVQASDGNTALIIAAEYGQIDVIKIILEKRPNLDLRNIYGQSALEMALGMGQTEIVKLLEDKDTK